MAKFCENINMLAIGRQQDEKTIVSRVRCKKWSCEYCARVNRVQWQMRIMRTLEIIGYDGFAFITITHNPKLKSTDNHLSNMQRGITLLLKNMRNHNVYDSMPYVRAYERHKSGIWHAHLIIKWRAKDYGDVYGKTNILIDSDQKLVRANKRWLKEYAPKAGLGYIIDWKQIQPAINQFDDRTPQQQSILQTMSYITKYMTKERQEIVDEHKPRKLRVIQASQEFKKEYGIDVDASGKDWSVQSNYLFDEFVSIDKMSAEDNQRKEDIKLGDFDSYGRYTKKDLSDIDKPKMT